MKDELQELISSGRLQLMSSAHADAAGFVSLIEEHQLGDGETECIMHALTQDIIVSCDDRKARRVLKQEIGEERVIGTLMLLSRAVSEGLLSSAEAYSAYLLMKRTGAFLPEITETELVDLVR